MIRLTVRTQFDKRKLKKKVETATFTSISEAGGAIRKTASRSIRKRKNSSKPGSPPNTQTGMLRRVIRYEVTNNKTEVIIGPVNEIAGRFGTCMNSVAWQPSVASSSHIAFELASMVRSESSNTEARPSLRGSNCEPQHKPIENSLDCEENERRSDNKPRHYPKRPFMKPALDANRSRLPMFWANSVK
jgi:hypothetical protein